jgi:hypothetical protein
MRSLATLPSAICTGSPSRNHGAVQSLIVGENGPTGSYSGPEFPYEKPGGCKRRSEVHPAVTICVQVVYKKAGLKGLKMDLSNAESTTDS